jgi:hypothetical protein
MIYHSNTKRPCSAKSPDNEENKELEGRVTMKINKIESLKYHCSAKSGDFAERVHNSKVDVIATVKCFY